MSEVSSLPSLPIALSKAIQSVNRAVPTVSCHLPVSLLRCNCSPSFCARTLPAFFEDNGIQKATRMRLKSQAREESLERRHCITVSRVERVKLKQELVRRKKAAKAHVRSVKRHVAAFQAQAEAAAVTIQRHVRGWLCRLSFEQTVIQANRADVVGKVQDMSAFAVRFYMTTGNGPAEASMKIQRAYRRYRRLKMIRVVADAYARYRHYLECTLTPVINSFVRQRIAYEALRERKFLAFRTRRLEEIRLNIARLKLERWWRSLGLTFKGAQDRIKRFRRRKNANRVRVTKQTLTVRKLASAEAEAVPTLDLSPEAFPQMPMDSGQDMTEELRGRRSSFYSSDMSESGLTQLLEEAKARQRREQMKQKFTACGIYKAKEVPLLPLLAEKGSLDLPKLKPNVFTRLLMPTEAMRYRSTTACVAPQDSAHPGHRRTITSTPHSVLNKRTSIASSASPPVSVPGDLDSLFRRKQPEPSYLQPTASFCLAVEARTARCSDRTTARPKGHWAPKSSLLNKTVAFAVKERKQWGEDDPKERAAGRGGRQSWVPLTGVYEADYVPALDNLGYQPKRFKALPLDRRILESPRWLFSMGNSRQMSSRGSPEIGVPSFHPYLESFPLADGLNSSI